MTSLSHEPEHAWSEPDLALLEVGQTLRRRGYRFITVSPASHARVFARSPAAEARTLRDVFGWSRPFRPDLLGRPLFEALLRSGEVEQTGRLWRSRVRFSSLGPLLAAHSAFPTSSPDAVFFGPDTYRFCALVSREVRGGDTVVDVGCGSGVGGLVVADRVARVVLTDPNLRALRLTRVNVALAGANNVDLRPGSFLEGVDGTPDVVVANPPYLVDPARRQYRHGGDPLGTGIAAHIARDALDRLAPGGLLVLYSGTPIVDGVDLLRTTLAPVLADRCRSHVYQELDPDVFGEELDTPAYADVERIALVSLVARRR